MTAAMTAFLDALKAAADEAEVAEKQFRREAAQRIAGLERERSFAFRRLNLMRAVAAAVAETEEEEVAVANAVAVLREKLGWVTPSEAREEVLSRFAAIGAAAFRSEETSELASAPSVQEALADFEKWYASCHPAPFLALFEQYIPDTPRVDF
jgi:hypothetical protein